MSIAPSPDFVDPFSSSPLVALETTLHTDPPPWVLGTDPSPYARSPISDPTEPDPDVEFRHSGWRPMRRAVIACLESMEQAEGRLARFLDCGSHAWVMRSPEQPPTYRITCNRCRDRFCTPCAMSRARGVANAVALFSRGLWMRMFTLTLRDTGATMKQDIDRLYRCFAKLRRRKLWWSTQKGGVYMCEIKRRGSSQGWHVHIHAICEGVWMEVRDLATAWHEITGDSFIVHIGEVKDEKHAAYYVSKYAGKGVHGHCYTEPMLLREAMMAIKGRRLIGKFGTWSKLDLKVEAELGDWLPVDSLRRLLLRSNDGDVVATAILDALRRTTCQDTARSPPVGHGPLRSD